MGDDADSMGDDAGHQQRTGADPTRLRTLSIFAGLTDRQLDQLADAGIDLPVEPGEIVFHEGDPAEFWWLLVDGTIDLLRHVGREDTLVARMVPGRWAGGFRAWDERGTYLATGRGAQAGTVFRLPADALRQLFAAWSPFGAHLISGLYHTARSIESTARQRSSLITLGTLAAGLAHELNNPASAATRAADSLQRASDSVLESLAGLAAYAISAAQFAELDRFRRELRADTSFADALARADREQALLSWLDRRALDRPWELSTALVDAGADLQWCNRVEAVLPGAELGPALHWVASTVALARLLSEVRESTARISELVAAVRSYSQMDRASRQRIQVTDGLESTLVMLAHKIRGGVVVERHYSDQLPEIEAFPGELNQVWTNLIDNAVDAMAGQGVLRIVTRVDGDAVLVEIADSGAGLPPEVVERVFEPFFTTKEVGKGTGLGLDIARRIVVERHGGAIDIDSRPGNTVLRVRLPIDAR
jgi:signal transduction histidine kinase